MTAVIEIVGVLVIAVAVLVIVVGLAFVMLLAATGRRPL